MQYSRQRSFGGRRGEMKLFAGRSWGLCFRGLAVLAMLALFAAMQQGKLAAQEGTGDDGVSAKVLSLEQLWNQAEVQQDVHSLSQLLTERFTFVDIDGSLIRGKSEFLESVTKRAERIESIRGESMLTQIHGDTVIVTGVYHEKGTLNGKPYAHHGRFTDTWIKEGSAWLCAASQSTQTQK